METFAGLEIMGEIERYTEVGKNQRPVEELEGLVRSIMADGFDGTLAWHQYTPYFNDGEPCVFNVYSPQVFAKVEGEDWRRDIWDESGITAWALRNKNTSRDEYPWKYVEDETYDWWVELADEQRERISSLLTALDSGEFDNACNKAFGDPSTVLISRNGIKVEYCDHD